MKLVISLKNKKEGKMKKISELKSEIRKQNKQKYLEEIKKNLTGNKKRDIL